MLEMTPRTSPLAGERFANIKGNGLEMYRLPHVSRDAIESSLIHGEPMQDVAGRYSISKSALHRHKNAHLPKALAKAQEAEEIVRGDSLLGEMEVLIEHGHE